MLLLQFIDLLGEGLNLLFQGFDLVTGWISENADVHNLERAKSRDQSSCISC